MVAIRAAMGGGSVMEELIYQSATVLAGLIRAKKVSSEEVVKACLHRIQAVNPKVNAVAQLTADTALAQARAADAALARGEVKGPLHGVPMTIKDSIETGGVISAAGTRGRAGYVPPRDATVVARVRAAGAVLLGTTNVPMPLGDPRNVPLKGLRVAFHTDNGIAAPTPETADVVRRAARSLAEAGLSEEEDRPEAIGETAELGVGLFG